MNVREVLQQAKVELQTRGRSVGSLLDGEGCACLLGAVGLAAGTPEEDLRSGFYESFYDDGAASPAVDALIAAIPDDFFDYEENRDYTDVFAYNDGVGPDADEVIFGLIDRAIEAAD